VESTPGVLAGSSKRVQGASSEEGHEPAKGSDMRTSYCGDNLAECDLGIGRLEPQSHFVNDCARPKLPGDQVPHTMQARDLNDSITQGGLVPAVRDYMLLLLIDMEVDQRARFLSRCLIRVVALSVVFDAMNPVADRYCSFYCYTLYITTEGRGEKVGCVAASALHRVPVLFLPYS